MNTINWSQALRIAGVLSIIVALVWLVQEPGFSAVLSLLAGITTLASSFIAGSRRTPGRDRAVEYDDGPRESLWSLAGKILLAPLALVAGAGEALFGCLPVIIVVGLAALPLMPLWAPPLSKAIIDLTGMVRSEPAGAGPAATYQVTFKYNDVQHALESANLKNIEIRLSLDGGKTVNFDARSSHAVVLTEGRHTWEASEILVFPSGDRAENLFVKKGTGAFDVPPGGVFWFERGTSWWGDEVLTLKPER